MAGWFHRTINLRFKYQLWTIIVNEYYVNNNNYYYYNQVHYFQVNGPLRSSVINVIFVHLIDDNGIRNYPGIIHGYDRRLLEH